VKICNECKIKVKENSLLCPLCSNTLEDIDGVTEESVYPELSAHPPSFGLVKRILLFISVVGCVASVAVNLYTDRERLWSAIIIAAILYFWTAISNLIRKNTNNAFKIFFQILIASLLAIIADIQLGNTGWALSYVVPSLFGLGSLGVIILIIYNRTNWSDYVLYQTFIALFGFVPFILYKTGLAESFVMSLISFVLSFLSLLATFFFGDRSIKNEFKRRFHF